VFHSILVKHRCLHYNHKTQAMPLEALRCPSVFLGTPDVDGTTNAWQPNITTLQVLSPSAVGGLIEIKKIIGCLAHAMKVKDGLICKADANRTSELLRGSGPGS